jgi:nicotinamidase-related amidase
MTRALVIIDIQNDYFPGGAYPLVASDRAVEAAERVLRAFRAAAEPVVHIQHVWDAPDATFMRPDTPGVEIHRRVTPVAGEVVIRKDQPNAFVGTGLESVLRQTKATELVVLGMMSSMCVDSTVRAASELGFDVTVVHDACAAPDLEFDGRFLSGEVVHASFMAALADGFARLTTADAAVA